MSNRETRRLHAFGATVGLPELLTAVGALHPDEAFFVVDGQRRILHWSDGAEALLGFTAAQAVGEHCLKTQRCVECMQGCGLSALGQVEDAALTLFRADGEPIRVRKRAHAFTGPDGTLLGGIEFLRRDTRKAPRPQRPRPHPRRQELHTFHGLVTVDDHLRDLFETIKHVAETEGTVLVRGESGTGKELVARALHEESHRRKKPFVAINCAALSPGLLESELFGHVRGAFTGAVRDRDGVFARAHGGTLFLDEVAELPFELQAKLLRVLQEKTFTPVGGTRPVQVDVRIIAATHRSLRKEVREGRFREDLMYRLRVIPLYLPPLRKRPRDIEALLWTFLERQAARGARTITSVAPEAMRGLLDHPWPGNVRELLNVVEYAVAVGRGPIIRLHDLPPEFTEGAEGRAGLRPPPPAAPAAPSPPASVAPAASPEPPGPADPSDRRSAILHALARSHGHVGRAAALLGVSRPTFWRWRKKHGI